MTDSRKNTLLIGCGYWGLKWANTLKLENRLSAICELDKNRQAFLREKYPNTPIVESIDEAIAHYPVDSAVIATPAITHANVAMEALSKGLHTLVEKPIATASSDVKKLMTLADEQNLVLAVGHLLVFHPAIIRLKELIDSGELGEVKTIQSVRTNLGKIREDENALWSLAPHDLSLLSFLHGKPFKPVTAFKLSPLKRSGIEDTVDAYLVAEDGVEARIHVSWLSPNKVRQTVVTGTKKIAVFDDVTDQDQKLKTIEYFIGTDDQGFSEVTQGITKYWEFDFYNLPLALEYQAFRDAIDHGKPLPNSGNHGLEVIENMEIIQDIINQRTPVGTCV